MDKDFPQTETNHCCGPAVHILLECILVSTVTILDTYQNIKTSERLLAEEFVIIKRVKLLIYS